MASLSFQQLVDLLLRKYYIQKRPKDKPSLAFLSPFYVASVCLAFLLGEPDFICNESWVHMLQQRFCLKRVSSIWIKPSPTQYALLSFRGYFRFALALFFSLTFFKLLVKKITYCTFTNSPFLLVSKINSDMVGCWFWFIWFKYINPFLFKFFKLTAFSWN